MSKSGFVPKQTSNPYKDAQGRYLTQGLFKETNVSANIKPPYTFVQAKEMYLQTRDPTEYSMAMELLNSWEHWKVLSSCDWFLEILTKWRDELEIMMRSEALKTLIEVSHSSGREAASAAKYIAEKGWAPKESGRGRPTKGEVQKNARLESEMMSRVQGHYDSVIKPKLNG